MKTFNELLASGTKGPFKSVTEDPKTFSGMDSWGECYSIIAQPMDLFTGFVLEKPDAERIVRLLNFAHNGGVDALLKWREARAKADSAPDGNHLADALIDEILLERDLTRALAILNGESPK